MTVDKFGGRGTDDRSGVSFNFMNKRFVRRDGGNTVRGLIDMTGNTLNNVAFPTSGCSNESLRRFKQRCRQSFQIW